MIYGIFQVDFSRFLRGLGWDAKNNDISGVHRGNLG